MHTRLPASQRALNANEAVVERVIASYLRPGILNLAPGVAHWAPTADEMPSHMWRPEHSRYGACHGAPVLLTALRAKLATENRHDMSEREVMVTNGANQAYVSTLLALCDPGDEVVLFRPYYFSHLVAIQLLGLVPRVLDCDEEGLPTAPALRAALEAANGRVKAVTLVSPSNPSGAVCGMDRTRALLETCREHGAWLVADEAYEHFIHEGETYHSPAGAPLPSELTDGVVSLFSFSKSYGLAGWRVGYASYPTRLHEPLLKVQDTLPTHATLVSQEVSAHALTALGQPWVAKQLASLIPAREALWRVLAPLHEATAGAAGAPTATRPRGAFYFLLPLPEGVDEEVAIARLAQRHGLLLLPGSAFGCPGKLRLSYGGLGDQASVDLAAERLARGVHDLISLSGARGGLRSERTVYN